MLQQTSPADGAIPQTPAYPLQHHLLMQQQVMHKYTHAQLQTTQHKVSLPAVLFVCVQLAQSQLWSLNSHQKPRRDTDETSGDMTTSPQTRIIQLEGQVRSSFNDALQKATSDEIKYCVCSGEKFTAGPRSETHAVRERSRETQTRHTAHGEHAQVTQQNTHDTQITHNTTTHVVVSSQSSCEAVGGIVRPARAPSPAGERGPGGETGSGHAHGRAGAGGASDAVPAQTHTMPTGPRPGGGETARPAEVKHYDAQS